MGCVGLCLLCWLIFSTAAADSDQVVVVATPQQLKQAIDRGAKHVHVTGHMDLRELPAAPDPVDCSRECASVLFWGPPALQSLTVRHSAAAHSRGRNMAASSCHFTNACAVSDCIAGLCSSLLCSASPLQRHSDTQNARPHHRMVLV